MSTFVDVLAFQPPRKEKAKAGNNNDSAGSAAVNNRRKTKSTSVGRRGRGHGDRPLNWAAVRRVEALRTARKKYGGPPPERGDIMAGIVKNGGDIMVGIVKNGGDIMVGIVKNVGDTTLACLCASATLHADAFLDSVPFPTRSQPQAYHWPRIDYTPSSDESGERK